MLFKCSNRPEQFEMFYDGLIIEAVRNFIYLGAMLNVLMLKNICLNKHLRLFLPLAMFSTITP